MFNSSFNEAVLTRLKQRLNIDTDRGLSVNIGLVPHGIANHKRAGSLPIKNIISKCIEKEISLDDIFGNQKAHRQ